MDFDVAAAFYVQALTVWHLLHKVSTTSKVNNILVHAIDGGVGLYLTQLDVRAGSTIIISITSDHRWLMAELRDSTGLLLAVTNPVFLE